MNKTVPYIVMKDINKSFGKVIANKNINFKVHGGEVHALLGENGAGKSTLMNMLSGVYTPDSGNIYVHGKDIFFSSPKDSIKHGIGMIYQHFKLVDNMTVFQNIIIGQKNSFFINKRTALNKINEICDKFGIDVSLNKLIKDMSVGEKQIVEIIKVLYRGADILIFDEPTTVFTPQEVKKLFKIINKMKENNCAVIFISHKMNEVMEICDKVTILRKGETVSTIDIKEASPRMLAELMVGKALNLSIKRAKVNFDEELLKVKNLVVLNEEKAKAVKGISFSINKGEVVGIAGVAGSGQKEICEAISGIYPIEAGEITMDGENIVGLSPRDIIKKGISMSFVPEDRLGMGLIGSMDMVNNLLLKSYHKQEGFLLRKKEAEEKAINIKKHFDIKTPSIYYPVKNLSGGNIQKILLGRELDLKPKLLIMAYPVRGLDINTCYTIYNLIDEQKKSGVSTLYIGEDIDVLINLCDRIIVLCNGEITGELKGKEATREKVGYLMAGNKIEGEEYEVV